MDLSRRVAILVALHAMMIEIFNVLFLVYCVYRCYNSHGGKRTKNNKRQRTHGGYEMQCTTREAEAEAEAEDRFLGVIANFCETTNKRLADITNRMIGSESDASERRKKVYDAVCGAVPGLSMDERLQVALRLVKNTSDMNLFFSLPDEKRALMVRMIIDGRL